MAQDITTIEATGSRWTKHGRDRIYINDDVLAEIFDGETSRAYIRISIDDTPIRVDRRFATVFFDLLTSEWVVTGTEWAEEIAAALTARFEATAEEAEEREAELAAQMTAEAQSITEPTTQSEPAGPRATDKQVRLIMRLTARGAHEEGGYMSGPAPTYEEATRMHRDEASRYIDSLTGNY